MSDVNDRLYADSNPPSRQHARQIHVRLCLFIAGLKSLYSRPTYRYDTEYSLSHIASIASFLAANPTFSAKSRNPRGIHPGITKSSTPNHGIGKTGSGLQSLVDI